jgi:hypothetical protein
MGCYLYGIGWTSLELDSHAGVAGSIPSKIEMPPLAAVVGSVPEGWSPTRDEIWAHANVLEHIARSQDILPSRLGIVFPDPSDVRALLDANQRDLVSSLERITGQVEVQVKADYKQDVVLQEIIDRDPSVARLRRKGSGGYHDRIRLGEAVAAALSELRRRDSAWALEQLAPLSAESTAGPLTNEYMMLNRSFLISREDIDDFDRAISKLEERPVKIRALGPMPPYSFVETTHLSLAG